MKHIIFIRGLPGSGKTTLAAKLAQEYNSKFFEADQFMVDQHGNYKFDIRKLGYAHNQCLTSGFGYLAFNQTVIFSNTFVAIRDFVPYIRVLQQNVLAVNLTANTFVANSNTSNVDLRANCFQTVNSNTKNHASTTVNYSDPISANRMWWVTEPQIANTTLLADFPRIDPNLDDLKITIYQPRYPGTSVHNVPQQTMDNYRKKWQPASSIINHFKRNLKKADIQYKIL